jgi:hypothetical protein
MSEVTAPAAVMLSEAAEVVVDDAHLSRFELRRRSPRRGARITVRTQAGSSVTVRPDPLQAALVDILGGWGDLTAEDTKRLELFKADKVVAAIAAFELPKIKSGEYARTRLTQLRQYSANLERSSRALDPVNPESESVTPLGSAEGAGAAVASESMGSAPIAPLVAPSVLTALISGGPRESGTVVPFVPIPSIEATEPKDVIVDTARTAKVLDFYGSTVEAMTEEPVLERHEMDEPPALEKTEQNDDGVEPPVSALAVAKLPRHELDEADVHEAKPETHSLDDPGTFWAESSAVWEPAAQSLDEAQREVSFEEATPLAYQELELHPMEMHSGYDSDEVPTDTLSRLSIHVETAEQLLALPPEERVDMTAFLEPSELAATFRATADPELKRAVIDTLEHIGSPASLTALGNCFDDPDGEIQRYALEAADRLLGVA